MNSNKADVYALRAPKLLKQEQANSVASLWCIWSSTAAKNWLELGWVKEEKKGIISDQKRDRQSVKHQENGGMQATSAWESMRPLAGQGAQKDSEDSRVTQSQMSMCKVTGVSWFYKIWNNPIICLCLAASIQNSFVESFYKSKRKITPFWWHVWALIYGAIGHTWLIFLWAKGHVEEKNVFKVNYTNHFAKKRKDWRCPVMRYEFAISLTDISASGDLKDHS